MNPHQVKVLRVFPEIGKANFDASEYCRRFNNSSLIVSAKGRHVAYKPHGGVLSVKCAFRGTEYYTLNGCTYAVTERNFLVINNGSKRGSFIDSDSDVESFTISFSPHLERQVLDSLTRNVQQNLDSPLSGNKEFLFTEKLFGHRDTGLVSKALFSLHRNLNNLTEEEIEEQIVEILQGMYQNQKAVRQEIDLMQYAKGSTRTELYHRLNRGRDFIWSNFKENIRLEDMAEVAAMNPYYFLREYKKLFGITPHKFLQRLRLEEGKHLLATTSKTVTEVCGEVGFSDMASFSKLYKRVYHRNPSDNS